MFYNNLKIFIKRFPNIWKFLRWSKDSLIQLSRLKDVLMMMIFFHIWPEQTYRFSTRRHLPSKKNRFSKDSKPAIPYDLLKSKSSNISMMKEINVVGIGSSFDLNNLKNLHGPIFLIAFASPLRIDDNGKIIYKHIQSYQTGKFRDVDELFRDQTNREYKKSEVIYVVSRKRVIERFKKNGNNVVGINVYATDKNENYYPINKEWATSSYLNLFDHNQYRLISIAAKIYKPPLLPPQPHWAPTNSFLPSLSALTFFAKKINVYGWDFYLNSSPENMNYWQLFFNMYNYKHFDTRGQDHYETSLTNFYYGYRLSKLAHIKIHGYMGKLGKHHKLIQRTERVLFN